MGTPLIIAVANPFDWNNLVLLGIAALTAWNAYRSKERDKKVEAVTATAKEANVLVGEISKKTDEIHTLADDNLSKSVTELKVANERIEGLQQTVASLVEAKGVADRLATAVPKPAVVGQSEAPIKAEIFNSPANPIPVTIPVSQDVPSPDKTTQTRKKG